MVRPSLQATCAEGRVGPDAVDREAAEVGDRSHLRRVELDDRVVEAVVACDHRSQRAAVLRRLGGHRGARAAAVRRRETDQLAAVVGADGGERAQRVAVDDDARPAAERDAVVGRASARAGRPARQRQAATKDAATSSRRHVVRTAILPSTVHPTLTRNGRASLT